MTFKDIPLHERWQYAVLNEDYSDALIKLTANKIKANLTSFDMGQIKIGMQVELKHGSKFGDVCNITKDDPSKTLQIVLGNLSLDGQYYTSAKQEGWGEIEAERDASDIPDKLKAEVEGDIDSALNPDSPGGKEGDELEINLDDDQNKDNKEIDKPEKEKELDEETVKKITEFLDKSITEGWNSEKFISQLSILADKLGKDYEELRKEIYQKAYMGIKNGTDDVTLDDVADENVTKIENKVNSSSEITDDLIATMAKDFGMEEKFVRKVLYAFAKKQYSKKKITKEEGSGSKDEEDKKKEEAENKDKDKKKDDENTSESITGFLSANDACKKTGKTKRMLSFEDFVNCGLHHAVVPALTERKKGCCDDDCDPAEVCRSDDSQWYGAAQEKEFEATIKKMPKPKGNKKYDAFRKKYDPLLKQHLSFEAEWASIGKERDAAVKKQRTASYIERKKAFQVIYNPLKDEYLRWQEKLAHVGEDDDIYETLARTLGIEYDFINEAKNSVPFPQFVQMVASDFEDYVANTATFPEGDLGHVIDSNVRKLHDKCKFALDDSSVIVNYKVKKTSKDEIEYEDALPYTYKYKLFGSEFITYSMNG